MRIELWLLLLPIAGLYALAMRETRRSIREEKE